MRYKVADIEDQILATLRAEASLKGIANIRTHAGEVSAQIFTDPALMEGFVTQIPFIFVQYQGRAFDEADNVKLTNVFRLQFRFFIGTKSLRTKIEAQRQAYDVLASVYDAIHAKAILSSPDTLSGLRDVVGNLSGTAISTTGFNPQSGFVCSPGIDERLIVNLPTIVVYAMDFFVKIMA